MCFKTLGYFIINIIPFYGIIKYVIQLQNLKMLLCQELKSECVKRGDIGEKSD
jgi:hypothetical protein